MKKLMTLAILLALASITFADQKIVNLKKSDGIPAMGQPASEQNAETWFGEDRMRRDDGDTSLILRLDEKKFYIVNHATKTYNEMPIPFDFLDLFSEEQRAQMAPMFENMKMEATIEKTEETQKVGEWNATLYKIRITNPMGIEMNINSWASKEIEIDHKILTESVRSILSLQPGSDQLYETLMSIEGYPVKQETVMNMMGSEIRSSEEIVSVEEVKVPEGHYSPNADYTLEEFDFQKMMGARGGM